MPEDTLAAKVRAKYPGAYDDLDDATLERHVRAKFPGVYDDLPRSEASTPPLRASQTPVSDALGGGPLAQRVQQLADLETGMLKGVAKTATGLGEAFYNYVPGVAAVSDAAQRMVFGDVRPAAPLFEAARQQAAPTNAAQQVGQTAEQIGEFLLPGAAAERTAVAVAGRLAPYVPKAAQVAARVVPRAAIEGTLAAGTAAVQGDDPRVAGTLAAAAPVVGPLAGRASAALKARSEAFVQAAIKPTVTALKRISGGGSLDAKARTLVRFIIDNRLTTPEKARTLFEDTERELQRVLSAQNAPTDAATRAARYLDALERSAAKQGLAADDVAQVNHAAAELLEGRMGRDVVTMVPMPHPTLVDPTGRPIMVLRPQVSRELRPTVPATEALESARASSRWGTRKQWGEQKGAAIEATKAVERAERDAVKAAVPEARGLLQTEAGALQAEDVLARMAQRAANRDAVSLPAHVIAAGELAQGKVPFWAALANMLRNNQLKVGIYADALADAIQRQDVKAASTILGRIGVGASAQTSPAVAR